MKDIYIYDVKMKNCRGHYEMEMDFPPNCFTVIQGKNGAGKSTIPKAISMALFGDDGAPSGEKLLITDMVNRKKNKDLEIKVRFKVVDSENGDVDEYRVELYYAHSVHHNQLFLFKNDVPISEKTKNATYKKIESILYPKEVYHNVVYFSQQVKNFFTSLTNTEQKQIFDSILQTQIYDLYYKQTFEAEKLTSNQLDSVVRENETLNGQLEFVKDRINAHEKDRIAFNNTKIKSISDSKFEINQLENKIQLIQDDLHNLNFSEEEFDEIKTKVIQLQQEITQMENSIDEKISQLNSVKDSELVSIQSEIQKREQIDRENVRSEIDKSKSEASLARSKITDDIREVSEKFSTSLILDDRSNFESEKRNDFQTLSFEISQLDSEYSTSNLEVERDQRIKIIDQNIQDLRDKSAQIKSEASELNASIVRAKEQISSDEKSLNGPVPVCSKCLRPFSNSEDVNVIKNGIEKLKIEVTESTNRINILSEEMSTLKVEFENANQVKDKAKADYDENIQAIILKKNQRSLELQRKQKLINDEIESYREESNRKITKLQKDLEIATSDLKVKRKNLDEKIENFDLDLQKKLNTISSIYEKETQNKILEQNKKYIDLKNNLRLKLNSECEVKRNQLSEVESMRTQLSLKKNQYDRLIHDKQEKIYQLNAAKLNLTKIESEKFDSTRYDEELAHKIAIEGKLVDINSQIISINRELEILKFWKIGFSDSGIKSMLIDMAIPHMNEAVANALDQMAPGVFTVSFDTLKENKSGDIRDKFNVNVLHNIKGTDSHKMLSGGEKRIVDLACMESLRSLSEKLYGKRIHNIFYDEVLDSLDDDNRPSFCRVSKIISKDKSVVLMTHGLAEDVEPDRIFKV